MQAQSLTIPEYGYPGAGRDMLMKYHSYLAIDKMDGLQNRFLIYAIILIDFLIILCFYFGYTHGPSGNLYGRTD